MTTIAKPNNEQRTIGSWIVKNYNGHEALPIIHNTDYTMGKAYVHKATTDGHNKAFMQALENSDYVVMQMSDENKQCVGYVGIFKIDQPQHHENGDVTFNLIERSANIR